MDNTLITILLSAGILLVIAVLMALILGWANIAFHVPTDPKVAAVNDILPGANCGGCGFVGCSEYAEAVANGKAVATLCGPGGQDVANRIAETLGLDLGQTWPFKAVVHCSATREQRLKQTPYFGEQSCAAANLVPGIQGCVYGCLGYGDCQDVCEYGAIDMVNGLAIIDVDKCTGCRACEKACPRGIITMIPFKTEEVLVVTCSNKDKGLLVKEVCTVGCIGCSACTKPSDGLIEMVNDLPVVNYDKESSGIDLHKSIEKCPRESLVFIGLHKDKKKAQGEPERIEANFASTVDQTEWRG